MFLDKVFKVLITVMIFQPLMVAGELETLDARGDHVISWSACCGLQPDDGCFGQLGDFRMNRIDPSLMALVVIDVQNDFCHLKGNVSLRGSDVSDAAKIIPPLQRIISVARGADVPIVFVRTLHGPKYDSQSWVERTGGQGRTQNCLEDTWGAEFYELTPLAGDLVVSKHRYSAFSSPEFVEAIEKLARPSLVFAGVATNVCVETTLREAICRDYFVTLLEDCCAAYSTAEHNSAIENVKKYFGIVRSSDEVLLNWAELESSRI